VHSIQALTQPAVRFIAVAKPETAPYGGATVEVLRALHLWDALQPKVVYAENITTAKQYAVTGNADCGFVAKSLLAHEPHPGIPVDEKLYRPIDQALAVLKSAKDPNAAARFAAFVTGPAGTAILTKFGYSLPGKKEGGMVGSR
jgi:molybdate transport system substrate-binding protein